MSETRNPSPAEKGKGLDPELEAMIDKALDAYTTRLRDDLDRVTRERDEALKGIGPDKVRRDTFDLQNRALLLMELRAEAAEAALAKRDEEGARLREAAWLAEKAMDDCGDLRGTPAHEALIEALTKEPTNAE